MSGPSFKVSRLFASIVIAFQAFALAETANKATCDKATCGQQHNIVVPTLLQVALQTEHVEEAYAENAEEGKVEYREKGDTEYKEIETPKPNESLNTSSAAEEESIEVDSVVVNVKIVTSLEDFADTETGANMSFMIGNEWTNDVPLAIQIAAGAIIETRVALDSWPSRMRINALGVDSWAIRLIQLTLGKATVSVFDNGTSWVSLNGSESESNNMHNATVTFDVPKIKKECRTRKGPSSSSLSGYVESPPGTKCIFGLQVLDNGVHCILDTAYGSFGWCYTSADQSSFGSCDENCPLIGENRVLGTMIKKVMADDKKMQETVQAIASVVGVNITNDTSNGPKATKAS